MDKQTKDTAKKTDITKFKWVIGTPYFVQGTSNLVEVPILYFIKFTLGMGDAGGQLFDSLRSGGWFIKPLWGYISDRIPLLGYHRKSWFILMALLAMVFWTLNAILIYFGAQIPVLFLITFNLAFATYAFVDVVCDALMVTEGRKLKQVGSFVNFQWTVLAIANAGAVFLGGWLQEKVSAGEVSLYIIFLITGIPPLFTALIGYLNIEEKRVGTEEQKTSESERKSIYLSTSWLSSLIKWLRELPSNLARNKTIFMLAVFIFFWRFSPSIGYIERSYLIDVRDFEPASFGVILSVGSVIFLVSIIAYRWVVRRFRNVEWDEYLYAMVAIGVLSFPLSFYLYLDPGHPWWDLIFFFIPEGLDTLAGWNRYEWFRLVTQIIFGFATIPAFIIPLTIAGETVKIERAGTSYAFLMSLSNVTNMFEGTVGAGLYKLFSQPGMEWLIRGFRGSIFDIAGTTDERTLILEIFVYISLTFTLLTIPFIILLKREFSRKKISIDLGGSGE